MEKTVINWIGSFSQGNGYSGASEKIAIELEKLGFDVRVMGFNRDLKKNMTEEGLKLHSKPFKLADVGVVFGFPNAFSSLLNHKIKIGFTMFETDRIPTGVNEWTGPTGDAMDQINKLDCLIVPSEHNRKLFIEMGAKVPVKVVHLGVDTHFYPLINRPDRETFTFLQAGVLTIRKNPGATLSAFLDLFKNNEKVRLVFKTNSGTLAHFQMPYKNITIIDRFATPDEMFGYYRDADAFVFPSRGEGFGLPPLEAMATGLPTIFANNTGMSEYANVEYNFPISCPEKTKAIRFPVKWGNVGNWYEIDYNELKKQMKYVYEHRQEAAEKGRKASEWVNKDWTFKRTAENLLTIINELISIK